MSNSKSFQFVVGIITIIIGLYMMIKFYKGKILEPPILSGFAFVLSGIVFIIPYFEEKKYNQ